MKINKSAVFYLAFLTTVVISTSLSANDNQPANNEYHPSAENMIFDGLVYRPLSLAGTLLGTGIFLVTLPFSLAGGNVNEASQVLVVEPAKSTFGRCLGCLPDSPGRYR
jgi:hypothetical protein